MLAFLFSIKIWYSCPDVLWSQSSDWSTGKWRSHTVRNWLVSSVARWLSPKTAKSCHEKLLDPAKNLFTNFQLKSAKNSEILLKKLLFLRCLK